MAAIALLFLSAPAHAYTVEGWDVRLFPEAQKATGCIMGGTFQDGTRLSVVVTETLDWSLALSNNSWNLSQGGVTPIAAYIDRRLIAEGKASHFTNKIAILPLSGASSYQALRMGHRLDIQTPAGNLNFQLKGTAKAMMAVLQCAAELKRRQPSTASAPPPPPVTFDFAYLSQAETTVLVTNLLNSAGVRDYRLDPPQQNNQFVSYRLRDGTRGYVLASRGKNTKTADEYTGVVIARASNLCKGEFMSAKKSIPSTDGSIVRQVLTTCKEGAVISAMETTIIRQTTGFLIDLSQTRPTSLSGMEDQPASNNIQSAIVDAAIKLTEPR
jgi:hypothetical protein